MEKIVKAANLSKTYSIGQVDIQAVKDVELSVNMGEFVSIMGPSGCGKSTLLCLLGGLTRPTKGALFVDNNDITRYSYAKLAKLRKKRIGFVFQTLNLLPSLTVLQNLKIALFISGRSGNDSFNPVSLLEQFGLGKKINCYPRQLSYGEQQRVAIARAIVNKPRILLADEPTGNLDSANTANVLNILKSLNKEHKQTIIMITHDPNVADTADRTLHMKDGRIV